MRLTMVQGQEHGLVLTKKITDTEEFMYMAYQQALNALREIVRQSEQFYSKSNLSGEKNLYGYAHNIIAFSGYRGQGKTSAMISFSDALDSNFENEDKKNMGEGDVLRKCSFTVLPPIDPTILEQDQSILAVILSRMYRQAEDFWEYACGRNGSSPSYIRSEAEKNELLKRFQQCLSGINAIKIRKGKEIRSLSEIHEISDSAVLKDNFNELTRQLLHFIGKDREDGRAFLVVQLDDTDFQIQKGYEILEDIRKYLTIPNLVILMATDMDMLRSTLTQHFAAEFSQGLQLGIVDVDKMQKIESKYLDKLIPPTYAAYLPPLDDMLRYYGDTLLLRYVKRGKEDGENILLPSGSKDGDYTFQSLIFNYVYRKTRIIFVEPKSYMHELIPTTLRGLAQFLGMLFSMRDVPDIPELMTKNMGTATPIAPKGLAELVNRQISILDENLHLFENYFLKDWAHTKLSLEKFAAIERLANAAPEQQYQVAVTQLAEVYEKDREKSFSQAPSSYARMVEYMERLKESHRQTEDFYFFFAIHTYFTIQSHKSLVRQKRQAVRPYLEERGAGWLMFDFSPERARLPDHYYLPRSINEIFGQKVNVVFRQERYDWLKRWINNDRIVKYLAHKVDWNQYQFNCLDVITLFLSLDILRRVDWTVRETNPETIYLVQTSAATVAINWDVQRLVQKVLEQLSQSSESTDFFSQALRCILKEIDFAIQRINCGRQPGQQMVRSSWLGEIANLLVGESGQSLDAVLDAIDELTKEGYRNDLCDIYAGASLVQTTLNKQPLNMETVDAAWRAFIDVCKPYDGKLDLSLLQSFIEDADGRAFWSEFTKQMRNLCKEYRYTLNDIQSAAKDRA